jgi:glycolate oxidase iron-sulfur subunit
VSTVDITPAKLPERRSVFTPELLDRCISCGFCLPACPTYALTGVETSSPRGRINLMRALETGVLPDDDPTVNEESSFCLGCRACEPVCPAGVQFGELLEEWRDHLWNGRRRPWKVKPLLWAVDSPSRVRAMGIVRRHAGRGGEAPGPVNLMLGCFERVLYPRVSRDARKLAPELAAPSAQGCCGALHAHNGELERGRELARELGEALPGTIVTTSGGCGAHLAGVLGAERVREFSQWWLAREGAAAAAADGTVGTVGTAAETVAGAPAADRLRIGLQDSCHLRNGLGVWREPRELIARIGEYVELPSAAACCGAAGSYSVVRAKDSARVLDPHLDEIAAADLDVLVVVNAGCYRQLEQGVKRRGLRTRVVHIAELLASEQ